MLPPLQLPLNNIYIFLFAQVIHSGLSTFMNTDARQQENDALKFLARHFIHDSFSSTVNLRSETALNLLREYQQWI